jgi:hypothetical protein
MLRRFDPLQVFEALKEYILNDFFSDGPAEEEIERDAIQHRFVAEHQGFEVALFYGHLPLVTEQPAIALQNVQ